MQATVRAETLRGLEPLKQLPRALARALPVTDVTAMTVPEPPRTALLMQEDCERLQRMLSHAMEGAVRDIVQQQVR